MPQEICSFNNSKPRSPYLAFNLRKALFRCIDTLKANDEAAKWRRGARGGTANLRNSASDAPVFQSSCSGLYRIFTCADCTFRAGRSEAQEILSHYERKLQAFLDFVLGQYVKQGVDELDQEKLASLLQLKYHTVDDALVQLGSAAAIRDAFVGFQQYLYSDRK